MNSKILLLSAIVIFLLIGCSKGEEIVKNEESTDAVMEDLKNTSQNPPTLKLEINKKEISSVLGAYNWSYFDKEENSMALVEKEALSPTDLGINQKSFVVDSNSTVELKFEKEPISYKVNIWDSKNNMKGPFNDVLLNEQKGKTIYEIIATWEQGTAHYIFSLDIK